MIGGVSVLSVDSQSSAARLGGEVSLSFSRFCSFFGSLSRTQCDPASHSPPRPRLFTLLAKTKFDECTFGMAVEERHKSPSPLGMAVEERHKSLLSLVLYVCIIGSAVLALPMTPLLGISREFLTLVEAYGLSSSSLGCTVGHSIHPGCSGSALLRLWHSPSYCCTRL